MLNESAIEYKLLPGTKDIWAIDYMPVQVEQNEFVQFTYDSAYLHDLKLLHTRSDVDSICRAIKIFPLKSEIILDGGNVVKSFGKAIISNIVFKDNPQIEKNHLIRKLENELQVEQIIFIPWDESDCTGHADGMVRFFDRDTVLINDWSDETIEFQSSFEAALHNAGLHCIEVPYNPYQNKSNIDATGAYINFLQMENVIILPVFGTADDEKAVKIFEEIFSGQTITTIPCKEISKLGGVLHCISWNIKK